MVDFCFRKMNGEKVEVFRKVIQKVFDEGLNCVSGSEDRVNGRDVRDIFKMVLLRVWRQIFFRVGGIKNKLEILSLDD